MKGKHLEECPFCHNHGCFSLVPQSNNQDYKCFSCQERGDVFIFLEKYLGLSKSDALYDAARRAGVTLPEKSEGKKTTGNIETESDQERMYRLAAEFYHNAMLEEDLPGKKYPDAQEWFIRSRGHTPDTLQKMHAGWSTGKLLPYLLEQGFTVEDCIKYGIATIRKKKGKAAETPQEDLPPADFFWPGLAIFPVIDSTGKVITLTTKDPSKKFPDLQLKGIPKKWFLNNAALGRSDILCEGQNDIASLLDIGIEAMGSCGAPGQEQLILLKNHYSGKMLSLWFDKDAQQPWATDKANGNGGASHIRFIYHGLADSDVVVKIIVHPGEGKDPDDYIRALLAAGKSPMEVKNSIRELKRDALDPLEWETGQLAIIPDKRDRLEAFKARKLATMINSLESQADQEIAVDAAAKAIGISMKAMEDLINSAVDLYSSLQEQFNGDLKKADAHNLSQAIFRWFGNGAGARFYKTGDDRVFLYYQRRQYEIGNNLTFNTLMFQLTRLAFVEKPGNIVWYFLQQLANLYGDPVDMMSWMHTDREKDIAYLNLNSDHNKIVRLAPGQEPELIDNGTNEQGILLTKSPQMRHFQYLPTASEADGFAALKSLIMDTTPCEVHLRYFLVAWTASIFLMNLQSDRGLVQITANSSVGKSKVAERISQLIYGASYVGKGTGAAETRVATNNPLMFLDNVENRNLTQGLVDFMLLLANSSHKPKAKSGSDSEVIYQRLDSMAIITSIEPFPGRLPELVNRAFHIELDGQFKQHGYMHDEVMRSISKNRNLILSVLLRMIAVDVLPNLSGRADWSKFIQTQHGAHTKDRNNEHICTMLIILEALLKRLPLKNDDRPAKEQAGALMGWWITYWNEREKTTSVTSNTLLTMMDGLAKEIMTKIKGAGDNCSFSAHPEFKAPYPKGAIGETAMNEQGVQVKVYFDNEYRQEFFLTNKMQEVVMDKDVEDIARTFQRLEFIITSAELYTLFNRFCKGQGIRNSYEGASALAARIRTDKDVMEMGGWTYISPAGKKGHNQYRKSGGQWYWRFSKRFEVRD